MQFEIDKTARGEDLWKNLVPDKVSCMRIAGGSLIEVKQVLCTMTEVVSGVVCKRNALGSGLCKAQKGPRGTARS